MSEVVPPFLRELNRLKNIKADEEELVQKDDAIAALVNNEGWEGVREIVNARIGALEAMLDIDDKEGFKDPTLVGFRFLATRVIIRHLREMIDLPIIMQNAKKTDK